MKLLKNRTITKADEKYSPAWMFKLTVILLQISIAFSAAQAQSRRVKVGDKMPEFTFINTASVTVNYKHGTGRVMVVAFLSANQKQSIRAGEDLKKILGEYDKYAGQFDFCVVAKDPSIGKVFAATGGDPALEFNLLLDIDHTLWGTFGIIAKPTVIIADKSNTIVWAKGGYSYDFALSVKNHLDYALGLGEKPSDGPIKVKTLKNKSLEQQIQGHVHMAGILEEKGRYSSAIEELSKAALLDPNSVEVALDTGQLYCQVGRNESAIKLADSIKPGTVKERSEIKLILGWAKRQLGLLDEAEILLREAVKLAPKMVRAHFELGKAYQENGKDVEAAKAYRKALELLLGKER